uniref:Ig-like domain-containing protein n=1 Tax=Oreochromis niloticus TaxID=8128 RepID=I3K5W7_ORENI
MITTHLFSAVCQKQTLSPEYRLHVIFLPLRQTVWGHLQVRVILTTTCSYPPPPGFIGGNDVDSPDEPAMAGHTICVSCLLSFLLTAIKPFCFSFTESVSNILITSSKTDLVEFNSSVTLVCSASGSPTSVLWLNGSSSVTANDRVHFTDGGSNLTIINVTRFDQGPFRCLVSNLLSNGTSDPLKLSISCELLNNGPENIKLRVNPSKEYYKVGSDIFFSCKADSKPPARYHWLVNGALGFTGGRGFGVIDARTSQSGNYSCQAFNSRTLRYETSQPLSITIVAIDSVGKLNTYIYFLFIFRLYTYNVSACAET